MSQKYTPPKVWTFEDNANGQFSNINRPTAGPRDEQKLPEGKHPFQLYSMATPNGVKVTIMFEELLALGIEEAQYDAFLIHIGEGDQFGSGFVNINPNSKIPALVDKSGSEPISIFESGSILLHLAEKFDAFIPKTLEKRVQTLNWLFWQVGSAPYIGGGFGHFYNYAPEPIKYAIDRFAMETKRQLDVLNNHLEQNQYMAGDEYTIADMAIFPWYGALVKDKLYDNAGEFLSVKEYEHVIRWADELLQRKPILKGRLVNRVWGDETQQMKERHGDDDFDQVDLTYQ